MPVVHLFTQLLLAQMRLPNMLLRVSGPGMTAPWREPAVGGRTSASHRSLSGVELLRGEVEGRIPMPPIARLTGAKPTDGAVGAATFSMPATPWLLGSQGLIAGGTLAILADGPLAAAIGSSLPPESGLVTSELSLRFLRPVRAGGDLVANGTLVHAGRSLGLSHVRVIDGDGRLVADGSSMCSSGLFHGRVARRCRPRRASRHRPIARHRD